MVLLHTLMRTLILASLHLACFDRAHSRNIFLITSWFVSVLVVQMVSCIAAKARWMHYARTYTVFGVC